MANMIKSTLFDFSLFKETTLPLKFKHALSFVFLGFCFPGFFCLFSWLFLFGLFLFVSVQEETYWNREDNFKFCVKIKPILIVLNISNKK